jgi:hypothetical protein
VSAESIAYALLTADAGIAAAVGARVFPGVLPQGQTLPAIVFELVSATPLPVIDATVATHLMRSRVQINLLGPDYAALHTLRDTVVLAVRHQRGTIGGDVVHSTLLDYEGPVSFDDALQTWQRPIDLIITHQQT